jgi:hypothetical protein
MKLQQTADMQIIKGKMSTEFRGVFPHQNILGFPGALYRLNIPLSVTTLLNRTALCALHQKPFCAAYILYLITVLFFYYTVVFSSNFYVVLTSFFLRCVQGMRYLFKFMKDCGFFSRSKQYVGLIMGCT